jgi:hypothetical protein
VLGSGAPDLVIDRQLGQRGQCQHFMALTSDGLSAVDPRSGIPADLITTAYARCIDVMRAVFDGILRDPYLAHWRVVGTYALMHGIEDSFSAAHVERDGSGRISHLRSWTLLDWPRYLLRGDLHFPAATHHGIKDHRDADYMRRDATAHDGRPCRGFLNPYAIPEECLSDRARAAVAAAVDYLIVIYRSRATALAVGRQPTLSDPSQQAAPLWRELERVHMPTAAIEAELPRRALAAALPRPDVFVGAQVAVGAHAWGTGAWGSHLVVGPALPFVLGETASLGFVNESGGRFVTASAGLGLLLPLVRRFTIGVTPAGFRVSCRFDFDACPTDVVGQLGELLIPLGGATWLGVEGPRWSWTTRSVGDTWFGVALGWSHEDVARPDAPGPAAMATWDPPRPDEVTGYRRSWSTRTIYATATARSTEDNQFVGLGVEWGLDRDRWNRRAGVAPGVQMEVDAGRILGPARAGAVALAPTLRLWAVPGFFALTATPALVRAGALAGHAFTVDVAGRVGVALELGRIEIAADSPPLSYVATSRRHALAFTARLGVWFD